LALAVEYSYLVAASVFVAALQYPVFVVPFPVAVVLCQHLEIEQAFPAFRY